MEKVAPAIAYRRLKYVSDWRLVEENQRPALAGIVHGISRLDAAGHWGDGTTSASATGNASPCRTRCCSEPTAHASTTSRSRIERSLFTRAPGSHRRATEHLDAVDRRRAAEDDAGGYR